MQARGKTVAMLLPNRFNAALFATMRDCIQASGGRILVVGFRKDDALVDSQQEEVINVDIAAENLASEDFDALVIVDSSTPEEMIASRKNLNLISSAFDAGKVIGTLDSGVELLLAALGKRLSGKNLTGSEDSRLDLESVGAVYTGDGVVTDQNIITAHSADNSGQFCNMLLEKLKMEGEVAA